MYAFFYVILLFCPASMSIADPNVIFYAHEMLTNATEVRCCSHGCAIYVYAAYCTSCFVKLLFISKPHHIYAVRKMWPIAADVVWSMSLCVCLFHRTKMVEPSDVSGYGLA